MSKFLDLTDADVARLNEQFGVSLAKAEWNKRLTTTPSYSALVRAYFDWHISELTDLALEDRFPIADLAMSDEYPPVIVEALEPEARERAASFMIETIRPIPEDGTAREERIEILTRTLPTGEAPDAEFVRRVVYLAGRWYHRPDLMDPFGMDLLRDYLFKAWPEYTGDKITPEKLRLWRTSEYVIGTVTVNSTLN